MVAEAIEWEYLGEVTGTCGAVFGNVRDERITDERIRGFDWTRKGRMRKLSYEWLANLREIVVDSERCPLTFAEFVNEEYLRDRDGTGSTRSLTVRTIPSMSSAMS